MVGEFYTSLLKSIIDGEKLLAVLIDPEKFDIENISTFLKNIPIETTHLFVGGSTVHNGETDSVVKELKRYSDFPVFLFPGDYSHLTPAADALLFLSLLSGRNAEYLVGQQVKSIATLKNYSLEIIPTGYVLIDGGNFSSVSRVTATEPLSQNDIETIVHTALAGQYMGARMIYLEAGSGAKFPVSPEIIREVKKVLNIPLIVGGGIRNTTQKEEAYEAGADMIVMGTVFESKSFN